MAQQTIIWTALPNGMIVDPDGGPPLLQLSVHVSPRLYDGRSLAHFPDFCDWPATMGNATFRVQFDDRPPGEPLEPVAPSAGLTSRLWHSVFPREYVRVEPYDTELEERVFDRMQSYPSGNITSDIKAAYQAVAIGTPTVPPPFDIGTPEIEAIQPFLELLEHARPDAEQDAHITNQVADALQRAQVKAVANPSVRVVAPGQTAVQPPQADVQGAVQMPSAQLPQARADFFQARSFFGIAPEPDQQSAMQPMVLSDQQQDPLSDFHKKLSSLREYPEVMRALFVVIDLQVPFEGWMQTASWVKVVPQWQSNPDVSTFNITPRTRCSVTGEDLTFKAVPGPRGGDIADGMLTFDDGEKFVVDQVDEAGAVFKITGTAQNAEQDPENMVSVPALRSVGLWVARHNRAATFLGTRQQKLTRMNAAIARIERQHPQGATEEPDEPLYAEDIMRGYRIDVREGTDGTWRSLCQRQGTYTFEGVLNELHFTDEGWISAGITEPTDGQSGQARMHEKLFQWDGWGLAVPRPGKPLPQQGLPESDGNEHGLDVEFRAVPGSLPRLRYGHQYQLRARAVDLAGNGREYDTGDESHATAPITFARHDPVSSPAVTPRENLDDADSPGESVDRVVIRSFNNSPSKDNIPTNETTERHIAPPKVPQVMAEMHGMFDGPDGVRQDRETYDMIVDNQGTLENVYEGAEFDVPYLPDPVASGVAVRFRSLQAADQDQVIPIPFEGEWPDLRSFRIRVVERTPNVSEPGYDPQQRLLTIPLEKGERGQAWLSCYIAREALEQMRMWHWIAEVQSELEQMASDGMHWMISPPHKLELVHAVQQPLVTPEFSVLKPNREIGSTYATLACFIEPVGGDSTAKIDLMARWHEPVDKLTEPEPTTIPGSAHVCDIPVREGDVSLGSPLAAKSGAHTSTAPGQGPDGGQGIQVGGQGRGRREGVQVGDGLPVHEGREDQTQEADEEGHAEEGAAEGGFDRPEMPEELFRKHEFGDTKYRHVRYRMVATSRFRECLPFSDEDIDDGRVSITRESAPIEVDILSSARPAAPNILYIVPTFGWRRHTSDDGHQVGSTREGGGLRVYMERPWYSSGDGELLGVVTLPSRTGYTVPENMKPYVTRWAEDPVYDTGYAMPQVSSPDQFPMGTADEGDLTLDEIPGEKVAVAGHEVHYDRDRQLWYCDIQVGRVPTRYFRFVRLALARYQPKSVKTSAADCKLSRVVLADFAQLTPTRGATFTMDPRNLDQITISVRGHGARTTANRHSELEVSVETRRANYAPDDEAGWRPVPDATTQLPPMGDSGDGPLYQGSVQLPAPRGTEPMRVVIKEYEFFEADGARGTPAGGTQGQPAGRRLVYADTLEI